MEIDKDIVTKLVFEYYYNNLLANDDFIKTIGYQLRDYYEIKDQLNIISIINSDEKAKEYDVHYNCYDFTDRKLYIDLLDKENIFPKENLEYNLFICECLFHKLDHARLCKELDNNMNTNKLHLDFANELLINIPNKATDNKSILKKIYYVNLSNIANRRYLRLHSNISFERQANIRACIMVLNILKKLNNTSIDKELTNNLSDLYESELFIYKTSGYKYDENKPYTSSPAVESIKKVLPNYKKILSDKSIYEMNNPEEVINNYNFTERVENGLFLTNNEYQLLLNKKA